MAYGTSFTCGCGRQFKVYVPRQVLMGTVADWPGAWPSSGADQEGDSDSEAVRQHAARAGVTFVDGRENDSLPCPGCGREINFGALIRKRFRGYPILTGDFLEE